MKTSVRNCPRMATMCAALLSLTATITGAIELSGANGNGAVGGGGGGSLRADSAGSGADGRVRIDTTDPLAFRNLTIAGQAARGTRMFALPATSPKLHLVSVAGQAIPVGAASGVDFELPAGSPAAQTVVLRGEGFTGQVAMRVAITPEHSASTLYDVTLNAGANPPEVSAQVTLKEGEPTRITAWTR